jgi:predicted RNA-binding Zn-ribbon protein involved in translation (DUF1610 family)
MAMGAKEAVGDIERRGEVYLCPACGYEDGFHVSFQFAAKGRRAEIYLICPNCHRRFRIGWHVAME